MIKKVIVFLVLFSSIVAAQQRGPWYLIGRKPDHTTYSPSISPSGTRVPNNSVQIVDSNHDVWTRGASPFPILKNGVATNGFGPEILFYLGTIYAEGNDLQWYVWSGTEFDFFGPNDPSTVVPVTTFYVSTTGDDSRSCATAMNIGTPKLTVNSGISCLSAGKQLLVRAGTYAENVITSPNGTSWANKVRIAAYPSESVTLKPSSADAGSNIVWLDGAFQYIDFDGINLDGTTAVEACAWISTNNGNNPNHIRFENGECIAGAVGSGGAFLFGAHTTIGATGANEVLHFKIHGGGIAGLCGFACAEYGVYMAGPNNLADGNEIYDTSGACVQIYNGGGDSADNNIVRNNICRDITRTGDLNQSWGFLVTGVNNQIYNNLIYGLNVGNAIAGNAAISVTANGTKIWFNTIYNNAHSGIYLDTADSNSEVRDNIVYMSGGSNTVFNGSGIIQSNNLVGTNPVFVTPGSTPNLHLQMSSPAKAAGITVSAVTTDKDGVTRASPPSIGAYE